MSEPTEAGPDRSSRFRFSQFDLKSLFILMLGSAFLVALHRYLNWASLTTLGAMLVALVLLERETRNVLAILIVVILIPSSWLLWTDYPWNSYRWSWIAMWPTLPGLLPSRLCLDFLGGFPQLTLQFVAGVFTILFLAVGTVVGRFNRLLFVLTVSLVFVLSMFNSIIQYGLFRA